jgi:hypothetical protein
MDEDARLRANRIGLLSEMAALFLRIADFSQIDVEERLRERAVRVAHQQSSHEPQIIK